MINNILTLKNNYFGLFDRGCPNSSILRKTGFSNIAINIFAIVYYLKVILGPNIHIGDSGYFLNPQKVIRVREKLHSWKLDGLIFLSIHDLLETTEIPKFNHPLTAKWQDGIIRSKVQRQMIVRFLIDFLQLFKVFSIVKINAVIESNTGQKFSVWGKFNLLNNIIMKVKFLIDSLLLKFPNNYQVIVRSTG